MPTTAPALPNIDILHLITSRASLEFANRGRPTNSKDGKEYHGNCPWCGGTDRFSIWPDVGRWSCKVRSSGCGRWGDGIGFLMQFENLTYHMACKELDIDPRYPEEGRALPLFMTEDDEPSEKWSEAAESFVWRAERYLWNKRPDQVKYVQNRELGEPIIKTAHFGYCPDWFTDSIENWGLTSLQTNGNTEIKIPEGLVIPWYVNGRIWKLSIRRPDGNYFQVLGSKNALYGIDALEAGKPILLIEGEFDALSVEQESGEIITPIATGGTSKGLTTRWITKLKQASVVLLGFDLDKNKAGDEGAKEWSKKLPNATRWTPWAHDCNEMLQKSIPLKTWVELGLKSVETTIAPPAIPVESIPETISPPALLIQPAVKERSAGARQPEIHNWKICTTCGKEAIAWKNSEGYCRACCPWKEELQPEKPTIQCRFCVGKQICKDKRKDRHKNIRARWIWYETDREWICINCYSPASWTL